jgi:hypothetical protein
MVAFASLEEVWNDAASYARPPSSSSASGKPISRGGGPCGSRKSGGGGGGANNRWRGTEAEAARSGGLPRPVDTGCRSAAAVSSQRRSGSRRAGSSPLCELYSNGFSSTIDDIMDTYTPLSDYYDKMPYSRTQAPLPHTSGPCPSRQPEAPAPFPGDDGVEGYRDDDDDDEDSSASDDEAVVASSTRGKGGSSRQQSSAPPEEARRQDKAAPPPREGLREGLTDGGEGGIASPAVVDLALYVVSGVLLIFLMEQLVQLGTRLRPAS